MMIPLEKFKIDHLSLIKGKSVKVRSGTPSLHDQLNLEEIYNSIDNIFKIAEKTK